MGASKFAVLFVCTIVAIELLCPVFGKFERVSKLPTTCSKEVIQDNILKACLYKRSILGSGVHNYNHPSRSTEFEPYADEAYVLSELLQAEKAENEPVLVRPASIPPNYRSTRGRSQGGQLHHPDHSHELQLKTSHGFTEHRQIRKQRLASVVHKCCQRECTRDDFSDYCADLD